MPVTAEFSVAISQTVPIQTNLPLNMAFPVQLSMENATMDDLLLGLDTTAHSVPKICKGNVLPAL